MHLRHSEPCADGTVWRVMFARRSLPSVPESQSGLVDRLDMPTDEAENAPSARPDDKVVKLPDVSMRKMVRPAGIEPATPRSVV
jgi:hypothetical protein